MPGPKRPRVVCSQRRLLPLLPAEQAQAHAGANGLASLLRSRIARLSPLVTPASPPPIPPTPRAWSHVQPPAPAEAANAADLRPPLVGRDGRVIPDFLDWLRTAPEAAQNAGAADADAAAQRAGVEDPSATAWMDSCAASLSVESSLAEQIPSKRVAWSTVGDRYLSFGSGQTVLLHLGVIAHQTQWASQIRNHQLSPSGEWILLADLAMGLCALGFKLVVAADKASMDALVHPFLTKHDYRWVVTDYDGLGQLETSGFAPFAFQDASLALRPRGGGGGADPTADDDMVDRYSHHCQVILLDAMGTSPEKVTSHRNYTRTNFFTGFRYLDNDLQQGTGFLAVRNFV